MEYVNFIHENKIYKSLVKIFNAIREVNKYYLIGLSIVSLGLIYIYGDSIIGYFRNIKPKDDDGSIIDEAPVFLDYEEQYRQYFKEKSINEEIYDLDVIKHQNKDKTIEYIDVESTN